MKQFVRPYQVKAIISANTIELDLPRTVKIYPVVNVSRVQRYKDQVEGQKKKWPALVIIEGEEEYKVEKILNKKKFREKDWYLVQQKGYMAEEDTWEPRENLGNTEDLVREFEEEYEKEIRQLKRKLPGKKEEENCQVGIQQRYCMTGMTRSSTRNIGDGWKEIG